MRKLAQPQPAESGLWWSALSFRTHNQKTMKSSQSDGRGLRWSLSAKPSQSSSHLGAASNIECQVRVGRWNVSSSPIFLLHDRSQHGSILTAIGVTGWFWWQRKEWHLDAILWKIKNSSVHSSLGTIYRQPHFWVEEVAIPLLRKENFATHMESLSQW